MRTTTYALLVAAGWCCLVAIHRLRAEQAGRLGTGRDGPFQGRL